MSKFLEKYKNYNSLILFFVLILISLFFIYEKLNSGELPPTLIAAVGRIDGDLINLNTKYSGRVKNIYVNDGQPIKKGTVVAVLESKEYQAREKQVENQIKMLQKQLKSSVYELEIAEEIIPNALIKAKMNVKIAQNNRKKILNNINKLKLKIEQDKRDYLRYRNLVENEAVGRRKLELVKLQLESDIESLNALNEELKTADKSVEVANIALNDQIATQKKIEALRSKVKALKDQIKAYKASLKEIKAILAEMTIKSPIDGYVVEKIANKGEVAPPGYTIATLIDPHSLYLKVFVDTIKNGKIKIGDKAEIFLDAYPDKPIPARVVRIAQKAEFTPKEVNVRSDRIQRVYAVHLKPLKVNPLLKLGIPAIGVISIDGKGLPKSLKDIPEI